MRVSWKGGLKLLLLVVLLGVLALVLIAESGLADRWAHQLVVGQIEKMTGARVELPAFRFHLWGLRAELDGLTLHGREEEGMPLFHADRIRLRAHIVSFWDRKIALDELLIERPSVAVRIDEGGRSNVPAPKVQRATRPWREQLFDLRIGRLRLDDGSVLYNDVRVPLAVEGQNFRFALDFDAPAPGKEYYVGALSWQGVNIAARRYLPFRSDLSARFTLARDSFSLDELRWKLPHSEIDARAELPSFSRPAWSFHYRGRLSFDDLRTILRKPSTPGGKVDFSGDAQYAAGEVSANGHYTAHDVAMPYQWFHAKGIESWGRYQANQRRLELPEFEARALGGILRGHLQMDFRNLAFRVESHVRGASLAAVLDAVNNPNLPVDTMHWDGSVDVDAMNTWTADFKHFRSRGESRWSPPAALPAGKIPATARIDYDYEMDRRAVQLNHSEISTPTSHVQFDGTLGAADSALEATFDTQDLLAWDDFINDLRGKDAEPKRVAGRASWKGRVLGPLGGPTFAGHVHAYEAHYDQLYWDEIEGDLSYSPDELRFRHARARLGHSTAALELWVQFDGAWSFTPENKWSLSAQVDHAPLDEVQGFFGASYPVHGLLTGDFHGDGTHATPTLDGTFTLDKVDAAGFQFDRFSGQLSARHDEIRLAQGELLKGGSRIAGNFLYRPLEADVDFAVTGADFPLERIGAIQSGSLPLGGLLDFDVHGHGPLRAPVGDGTVRLLNLRVGSEVLGSFDGRLHSDGTRLQVAVHSEMAKGKLQGQLELGLSRDYSISGELTAEQLDLDPLLQSGLHLKALTGHSSVDGKFVFSGALRDPDTLVVQANISHILFDYESVKLENVGPVQLTYRRNEVRIEEATLRGPDTDFHISGSARFAGDRALNLKIAGDVNLRLLSGLFPALEARGAAQVNTTIGGTYANPRITGNVRVADAALNYGDFPAGLSRVNGVFVFNSSRLLFQNVTAQAGGGALALDGSVSYGDGALSYVVNAAATHVRVRYPEGMSWLGSGTLQFAGTPRAASLSGKIVVERVLMGEGVDLGTLIAAASSGNVRTPATSSPYLENLQFDLEVTSSPGARVEWTGARFETEGDLRVRGTWQHPVMLGHVHLLAGEMEFRGSKYQLSRGDINFSNPFRVDPVLNVEATTTIQQYEITLDFTGPASHPSLTYRSDPPLPAGDIVALLALGSTGQESALRSTPGAAGQGYGATAVLSEAISSQLGGRIERLFGISRFSVDPFLSGTTTSQNAAARVTIEQQLTHDLTVTYSTNASGQQEQVIQVEYTVRRDISIVGLRDINGTFDLSVKFKKHFK